MNFGKLLIEEILEESNIKNIIVLYPGRFQPFGLHHAKTFRWIQSKFGSKNSYIVTSDKVEIPKSPFNFNEKKKIINKYGFNNVVNVRNPYIATEVVSKYDPETTSVVFVVGKKDLDRLSGSKFYREWNNKPDVTYRNGAYYLIAPHISLNVPGYGEMSGTSIRKSLGDRSNPDKKDLFKGIFGFFDKSIYDIVTKKLESLHEIITRFRKESKSIKSSVILENLIQHANDELKLAGLFDEDSDYNGMIAKATMELIEKFSEQGHSGFSAQWVRSIFNKLANYETLTPITSNPDEWSDVADCCGGEKLWQSKRNPALFSKDGGKTWYHVDDKIVKEAFQNVFKELLLCGGAAKHMFHPFEDNNLTFGDFKQMITGTLSGNLDVSSVAEKTDGLNIFVTYKNGKLYAARNKGQVKNPITAKQIAQQFEGRGDIKDAFVFAMNDLEKAVGALSDKQKVKIFDNGKNFMNLEIIYSKTKNVIDYDKTVLQFHGAQIYDDNGNPMGELPDAARILAGMIKQVNADVQKHFNIIPPKILKLGKAKDFGEKISYFLSRLNSLQKRFNLKDTDTLGMYHQAWWQYFISNQAQKLKYPIPNKILMNLVNRWAFFDKSYKISDIKKDIDNDSFLNWVLEFDKKDHGDQVKKNIEPFEYLFLELGVEVLKNIEGFLSANPDKTVQDIRNQVAREIKNIKLNGSPDQIKKLETQLNRIQAIGGFSGIVPSEGIVIKWNGVLYKLTGIFAPLGQLLGIIKYAR